MPGTDPIKVKVVFNASAKRGRRGKIVSTGRRRTATGLVILSVLNLAAAGGLCYVTAWPAEEFIIVNSAMRTPFRAQIDMDKMAAQMFGLDVRQNAAQREKVVLPERTRSRFDVKTTQWIIGTSAATWLILATMASCALALTGGAGLGRTGGKPWRIAGWLLFVGALGALAWTSYEVWREFGIGLTPARLRPQWVGLVATFACFGVALGRCGSGLARTAAMILLLSAIATPVGLYLAKLSAVVDPAQATTIILALAFVVHSLWAWILLFIAPRAYR